VSDTGVGLVFVTTTRHRETDRLSGLSGQLEVHWRSFVGSHLVWSGSMQIWSSAEMLTPGGGIFG
jgi:hypothetical protein